MKSITFALMSLTALTAFAIEPAGDEILFEVVESHVTASPGSTFDLHFNLANTVQCTTFQWWVNAPEMIGVVYDEAAEEYAVDFGDRLTANYSLTTDYKKDTNDFMILGFNATGKKLMPMSDGLFCTVTCRVDEALEPGVYAIAIAGINFNWVVDKEVVTMRPADTVVNLTVEKEVPTVSITTDGGATSTALPVDGFYSFSLTDVHAFSLASTAYPEGSLGVETPFLASEGTYELSPDGNDIVTPWRGDWNVAIADDFSEITVTPEGDAPYDYMPLWLSSSDGRWELTTRDGIVYTIDDTRIATTGPVTIAGDEDCISFGASVPLTFDAPAAIAFGGAPFAIDYGQSCATQIDYTVNLAAMTMTMKRPALEFNAAAELTVVKGETFDIVLNLVNSISPLTFDFWVMAPDGIDVVSDGTDYAVDFGSRLTPAYQVVADYKRDTHDFTVIAYNTTNQDLMAAGDGPLCTVGMTSDVEPGRYEVVIEKTNFNWVKNGNISTASPTALTVAINVVDHLVTPGDVNGDGRVDSTDIAFIIDDMLGIVHAGYIPENADINADSAIDATDIGHLISLMLNS